MGANATDLQTTFGDFNTTTTADLLVRITSTVNYVLLAISTWILINMAVYGWRRFRKRLCTKRTWMFLFCYTGVLLNFVRILVLIVLFHLDKIPEGLGYCPALRGLSNCLSSLNLAFTYGLLWFRQKLFHSDELLKGESYNKYVTILSWVTIVMLFTSPILVVCLTLLSYNVGDNSRHCVYVVEREEWLRGVSWAIFLLTVTVQLFLLFLIIFPMAYIRKRSQAFMQKTRCKDRLLSTIRRCIICGILAVVTDVILLSLVAFLPKYPGYPILIGDSIINIDLVVNDICIIATFKSAPKMLTGALHTLRSRRSDSVSGTWDQRTSTNDL